MTIDILELAGMVSALAILGGVLFGAFRFYDNTRRHKDEINRIKSEQTLICFALTACLNGLHQLGANGEVTDALKRMNKHLNQAAHDEE